MHDPLSRPRLRPLEVFPLEHEGRRLLGFRDPEGIAEQEAALEAPLALFLIEMLDGKNDFADIQVEFARRSGGQILKREQLVELLGRLDEAGFLEGPSLDRRRAEHLKAWRSSPGRRPYLAGQAYPEDPAELRSFLDHFYETSGAAATGDAPLRAVAAPHLDPRSGGGVAARALAGAAGRFAGTTVVVFATGHRLGRRPFALTDRDFETPLGTVPVDRDLFQRVVGKAGSWTTDEELVHRGEHSAEFAAVFLRHAFGDRELRILPVLCGSFHHFLVEGESPIHDPLVGAFLETIAEEAPDALFYASVDLAHVGPHYGDPAPMNASDLAGVEAGDREMLDLMARRDAEGFFDHFRADQDRRRVCGMSAIYSMLTVLPAGPSGRLAAYEQPVFPAPGNSVTICGMTWDAGTG